MDWLAQLPAEKLILFALVFARVSGLFMVAPIYGTNDIPMRIRALLSFAVAALVMPGVWSVEVPDPGNVVVFLIWIAAEVAIGFVLGFGVVVLVSGIELAGELVARIGGIMLADTFDPSSGSNVPLFSRLFSLMGLAIFVVLGGHRILLDGLLTSFDIAAPGAGLLPVRAPEVLLSLLAESFVLGVRASAPVVTALLVAILVLGLISRTVPQLNILAVGFGLNAMLTFAGLLITVGIVAIVFQEHLEVALDRLIEQIRYTTTALS
ncbi:flagellar biosynthetic protein FliR [Thermostilla marina]